MVIRELFFEKKNIFKDLRFFKKILKASLGIKIPLDITFQLTFRCNLNCRYCGLSDNEGQMVELTTKRAKEAIKEFASAGTQRLSFTGGEPLIRDDFYELIDFARKSDISWVDVFTNGCFVEERIESLKKANRVYVSLDGPRSVQQKTRGKGSYENAVNALESLKLRGINSGVMMTLNDLNTGDSFEAIDHVLEIANEYNSKFLMHPIYSHKWNRDFIKEMRPDQNDLIETIGYARSVSKESKRIGRPSHLYDYWLKWIRSNKCSLKSFSGLLYGWIFPNGDVAPCHLAEEEKYNGLDRGFIDAFEEIDPSNHVHDSNCIFYGLDRDFWFNLFGRNFSKVMESLWEDSYEFI